MDHYFGISARLLSFLAAAFLPFSAYAESGQLRQGMSYVDVARLLGAPEEQREYETKREVVWLYQSGEQKIFFKEGRVIAWTDAAVASRRQAVDSTPAPAVSGVPDAAIQDLLGELTKEGDPKEGES